MYDKVPNNMNFVEREVQVEKYWKDNDIFGKSIKAREGAPVFTDRKSTRLNSSHP